jgi:hypothetical protein
MSEQRLVSSSLSSSFSLISFCTWMVSMLTTAGFHATSDFGERSGKGFRGAEIWTSGLRDRWPAGQHCADANARDQAGNSKRGDPNSQLSQDGSLLICRVVAGRVVHVSTTFQ